MFRRTWSICYVWYRYEFSLNQGVEFAGQLIQLFILLALSNNLYSNSSGYFFNNVKYNNNNSRRLSKSNVKKPFNFFLIRTNHIISHGFFSFRFRYWSHFFIFYYRKWGSRSNCYSTFICNCSTLVI